MSKPLSASKTGETAIVTQDAVLRLKGFFRFGVVDEAGDELRLPTTGGAHLGKSLR